MRFKNKRPETPNPKAIPELLDALDHSWNFAMIHFLGTQPDDEKDKPVRELLDVLIKAMDAAGYPKGDSGFVFQGTADQ